MKALTPNTVESSELVEETFKFWFTTNNHIRSPFPLYIQSQLKELAVTNFFDWAAGLSLKAKEEVNDEIIAEKFEEIIFEIALELVKTEDEKITIQYPFLPRLDDVISNPEEPSKKNKVIDRYLYKEQDHSFLIVKLINIENEEKWETSFELPL